MPTSPECSKEGEGLSLMKYSCVPGIVLGLPLGLPTPHDVAAVMNSYSTDTVAKSVLSDQPESVQ